MARASGVLGVVVFAKFQQPARRRFLVSTARPCGFRYETTGCVETILQITKISFGVPPEVRTPHANGTTQP